MRFRQQRSERRFVMMMLFNAFAKKLFGVKYEKLLKSVFICFVVYEAALSSGYKLAINPFILYLMSAVFTAGMMWQGLNASDTSSYIRNMVMMPFDNKAFAAAYIGSLGIYNIISKTLLLWAVVFAVGSFDVYSVICAVLAAVCGVLIISVIYTFKKIWFLSLIWAAVVIGCIFGLKDMGVFVMIGVFGLNILLAAAALAFTNGYALYDQSCENIAHKGTVKSHKHNLVWTYLLRYITSHKNYMFNTLIIWAMAVIIPWFLTMINENPEFNRMLMYIGYGLVVVNTPLCILVSCDPDLERGLRCLPGNGKDFFIPYGAFLFVSNSFSYVFYLVSWNIRIGGVTVAHMILAVICAALSAFLSIMMEKFFTLKKWKIESDLWHHPRKYVVPIIVMLTACLIGSFM